MDAVVKATSLDDFTLGIGAVVILQLLFTYAPPFQVLFETEAIAPRTWLWLMLRGFVFFLAVEMERLFFRIARSSHRTAGLAEPAAT